MKQGQWVGGRIPLECIRKSLQTGRPNRPLRKHGVTYLATIIIVIIVTIISMIIITHHHHQSPFIIMRRHHQMDFKDKLAYRALPSMVGIQADLTQANSITALSLPLEHAKVGNIRICPIHTCYAPLRRHYENWPKMAGQQKPRFTIYRIVYTRIFFFKRPYLGNKTRYLRSVGAKMTSLWDYLGFFWGVGGGLIFHQYLSMEPLEAKSGFLDSLIIINIKKDRKRMKKWSHKMKRQTLN